MPHGNAIVHGYGVELFGDAACGFNFSGDKLTHVFEVHMPRYKLSKGVGDGDNRLLKIAVFHSGCPPKCACTRHIAT